MYYDLQLLIGMFSLHKNVVFLFVQSTLKRVDKSH